MKFSRRLRPFSRQGTRGTGLAGLLRAPLRVAAGAWGVRRCPNCTPFRWPSSCAAWCGGSTRFGREVLARRASNTHTGAYPQPVAELLGEMTAAAMLMQANIKFKGSLILQIFGDGLVAAGPRRSPTWVRTTASVVGEVAVDAALPDLVNVNNKGRCAITLDPKGPPAWPAALPAWCRSATAARSWAS